MFLLLADLSSTLPRRLPEVVRGAKKSWPDSASGLSARGLKGALGLVFDDSDTDFLTVATEDDMEFDLEVLL
jgi:hypothetical protein